MRRIAGAGAAAAARQRRRAPAVARAATGCAARSRCSCSSSCCSARGSLIELFQPFTGSGTAIDRRSRSRRATARARSATCSPRDGVVSSGFFFDVRAIARRRRDRSCVAGTFTLRHGMSYSAALAALTAPPPAPVTTISVTIPEGFTRRQIAALASGRRPERRLPRRVAATAAGFDPRTYGAPAARAHARGLPLPGDLLLDAAARACASSSASSCSRSSRTSTSSTSRTRAPRGLTEYDVLIIASMVEREAQVPERPRAGRGRDLQPPARRDDARHRRDAALRAERLHPPADRAPSSRSTRRTTRASTAACRRRRSATPGSRRWSRRPTRRPSPTSTTSTSRAPAASSRSRRPTRSSRPTSAAYNAARNAAGGRSPTTCP